MFFCFLAAHTQRQTDTQTFRITFESAELFFKGAQTQTSSKLGFQRGFVYTSSGSSDIVFVLMFFIDLADCSFTDFFDACGLWNQTPS